MVKPVTSNQSLRTRAKKVPAGRAVWSKCNWNKGRSRMGSQRVLMHCITNGKGITLKFWIQSLKQNPQTWLFPYIGTCPITPYCL